MTQDQQIIEKKSALIQKLDTLKVGIEEIESSFTIERDDSVDIDEFIELSNYLKGVLKHTSRYQSILQNLPIIEEVALMFKYLEETRDKIITQKGQIDNIKNEISDAQISDSDMQILLEKVEKFVSDCEDYISGIKAKDLPSLKEQIQNLTPVLKMMGPLYLELKEIKEDIEKIDSQDQAEQGISEEQATNELDDLERRLDQNEKEIEEVIRLEEELEKRYKSLGEEKDSIHNKIKNLRTKVLIQEPENNQSQQEYKREENEQLEEQEPIHANTEELKPEVQLLPQGNKQETTPKKPEKLNPELPQKPENKQTQEEFAKSREIHAKDASNNLAKFVTSKYFLRGVDSKGFTDRLNVALNKTKITTNVANEKLLEVLTSSSSDLLIMQEKRSWGRFVCDLFTKVLAFFTCKDVGQLMGEGAISFNPKFDMSKLEGLFKVEEKQQTQQISR